MKQQTILIALMILFLLFGCAAPGTLTEPPAASPGTKLSLTSTARPIPTATEKDVQSRATEPVDTPTVAPTLEPPLKTKGPYLAYFRSRADVYQVVLIDEDGERRKAIDLPREMIDTFMDDDNEPNTKLISPDGHWLAFYTGSAGSYTEMPAQGTADLALHILDLETGELKIDIPLLSEKYPNNFAEAAKSLNDPYLTAESLYHAFYNGITSSIGWSLDGRYLAFAGQMEGLSSDLYVYDVNTQEIRRLSSGDQEVQWLSWSPDENRILHGSVFAVGEGMSFDVYAANLDGTSAPHVSTSALYEGITEWLNPHQYLENDSQNGPGNFGLRAVDIDTGKITNIWKGAFLSYGVDRNGKWVVIMPLSSDSDPFAATDTDPNFQPGHFYLVNLETLEKIPVPYPAGESAQNTGIPAANANQEAIFLNNPGGALVFYLSDTGEFTSYDLGDSKVSPSPTQKYWAEMTDGEIKVFSVDRTELKKIPLLPGMDSRGFDITWRPDDSGFFLVGSNEIYSVNIEKSEVNLVETNFVNHFGYPRWTRR